MSAQSQTGQAVTEVFVAERIECVSEQGYRDYRERIACGMTAV
jgi:hypothetical protein